MWRLHLLNNIEKIQQVFAIACMALMPTDVTEILSQVTPTSNVDATVAIIQATPSYQDTLTIQQRIDESMAAHQGRPDTTLLWLKRVLPSFVRTTRSKPLKVVGPNGVPQTASLLTITQAHAVQAITEGMVECVMKYPMHAIANDQRCEALRLPALAWSTEASTGVIVPWHPYVAQMHQNIWRDKLENEVQSRYIPEPHVSDWEEVMTPDREAVISRMLLKRDWDPEYYFDVRSLSTPSGNKEVRLETGSDIIPMKQQYEAERYLFPTMLRDPGTAFPEEGTKYQRRRPIVHPVPALPCWGIDTKYQQFFWDDRYRRFKGAATPIYADQGHLTPIDDICIYLAGRYLEATSRLERAQQAAKELATVVNVHDPMRIIAYLNENATRSISLWNGLTEEQIQLNKPDHTPRNVLVKVDYVFGKPVEDPIMDRGPPNHTMIHQLQPSSAVLVAPMTQQFPAPNPTDAAGNAVMKVEGEEVTVTGGARLINDPAPHPSGFPIPDPLLDKKKKKDRTNSAGSASAASATVDPKAGKKKKPRAEAKAISVPTGGAANVPNPAGSSSDSTPATAKPKAVAATTTPTPVTLLATNLTTLTPTSTNTSSPSSSTAVTAGPTAAASSPTKPAENNMVVEAAFPPTTRIRSKAISPSPATKLAVADGAGAASPPKRARTRSSRTGQTASNVPASASNTAASAAHVAAFATTAMFGLEEARGIPQSSLAPMITTTTASEAAIVNAAERIASSPLSPAAPPEGSDIEPPPMNIAASADSEVESDANMGVEAGQTGSDESVEPGQITSEAAGMSAEESSASSRMDDEAEM
eukprot:GHVU01125101.1.p1 GENE.GHVU01125101.1~~GHVU01125101.1.p1  ORF type:complete len:815 (-),score=77.43 GHVU01125101.1:472-2916(-)